MAQAWHVASPPKVDFRTHFLAVHVASGYGILRFEIDGTGDLRGVGGHDLGDDLIRGGYGPRYLIKSFRRSEVKTVNGLPLPR